MRYSSPANSDASAPPVPARISKRTFFSSLGSRGVRSCFNLCSTASCFFCNAGSSALASSRKSASSPSRIDLCSTISSSNLRYSRAQSATSTSCARSLARRANSRLLAIVAGSWSFFSRSAKRSSIPLILSSIFRPTRSALRTPKRIAAGITRRRYHSPVTLRRTAPWAAGAQMLLQSVLALEALDAPRGVDQTLLAGVKRMTVRADLDVQLFGGRASLKGVAARAGHYAAAVFGMNFGFHLGESNHSFLFRQRYHHPPHQTIPRLSTAILRCASVACATLLVFAGTGIACAETPASYQVPAPGFSSQAETIFDTVLALAAPGPFRAQRSLAIADRQLDFQGKIWLHPEFSPPVRKLLDQLPPRQATIIRAASLYSRKDIAWTELPEKAHQVSVIGHPEQESYLYELSTKYQNPELPFHMSGAFTLKPVLGSVDGDIRAVDGQVDGDLLTNTYGASGGLAFLAALLRFMHGDLCAPWDTQPGVFNHHDRAILDRFHTDFPNFSAKVEHYVKFRNVVDEFAGSGDPVVL